MSTAQDARNVLAKLHDLLEQAREAGAGQLQREHEVDAALTDHKDKKMNVKEAVRSTRRMKEPTGNLKKTVEALRSEIAEIILILQQAENTEGFIHTFKDLSMKIEVAVNQLIHDLYGGSKSVQELVTKAEVEVDKKKTDMGNVLPLQQELKHSMKDLEKQNARLQALLKHLGTTVTALEKRGFVDEKSHKVLLRRAANDDVESGRKAA
jgi:DNA repair exonuclease SbcCD ATPase subunit